MRIQKGHKVFVSSTANDFKDIRAEVVFSLTEWGLIALNHENPNFPVRSELHNHDICLEAVKHCDTLLLIIGGKYGTIYNGDDIKYKNKHLSITRCEADVAFQKGKDCHTFVRDDVYYEWKSYNNYVKERGSPKGFYNNYADNIEIYEFLNDIQNRRKSGWIDTFSLSPDLKEKIKGRLTVPVADIYNSNHFKKTYKNEN